MNLALFILMIPLIGFIGIIGMDTYLSHKSEERNKSLKKDDCYSQYDKDNDDKDISEIICNNLKELRGYYQLSKEQARKAFKIATISCGIGVFFYCIAIAVSIMNKESNVTPTIISGTFTELIGGSVFVIYKKSLKQLEIYHNKLEETEKYLMVIRIINNMEQEKQNERYSHLIDKILGD